MELSEKVIETDTVERVALAGGPFEAIAVDDRDLALLETGRLPRYLGAFAWRFNCRSILKTIHERLAIAATKTPPMPYRLLKLAEARW